MNINLTDNEKEFFLSTISQHRFYLEYGSGETTAIANRVCQSVVSIETDKKWADKTGAIHVDMGETLSWGYPKSPPSIQLLNHYLAYARDSVYDILMIDGRWRVAVAYYARPCYFMIHDYNRQEYQVIETFAYKLMQTETLALFQKKERLMIDILNPI